MEVRDAITTAGGSAAQALLEVPQLGLATPTSVQACWVNLLFVPRIIFRR